MLKQKCQNARPLEMVARQRKLSSISSVRTTNALLTLPTFPCTHHWHSNNHHHMTTTHKTPAPMLRMRCTHPLRVTSVLYRRPLLLLFSDRLAIFAYAHSTSENVCVMIFSHFIALSGRTRASVVGNSSRASVRYIHIFNNCLCRSRRHN